jgi:hypothetical protein
MEMVEKYPNKPWDWEGLSHQLFELQI